MGLQASNPDMIHPKNIHDYVEAAVCRIYKLPAAVVQFGLGIEATTQNATLMQYEKQAWETGLIPVGDPMGRQMGRQLLPAFGLDTDTHRLRLDYSHVEVLQEAEDAKADRIRKDFESGLITRATALDARGYEVKPTDHVRHLPLSVVEVPDGLTQLEVDEQRREALPEPTVTVEPPEDSDAEKSMDGSIKALTTRQRQALLRAFNDDFEQDAGAFAAELEEAFGDLGKAAEAAAREVLR